MFGRKKIYTLDRYRRYTVGIHTTGTDTNFLNINDFRAQTAF